MKIGFGSVRDAMRTKGRRRAMICSVAVLVLAAPIVYALAGAHGPRTKVLITAGDDIKQAAKVAEKLGGKLLAQPTRTTQVDGYVATFPNGLKVELKALSRDGRNPDNMDRGMNDLAWQPSGAPFTGPGTLYCDLVSHQLFNEPKAARYLTFAFTSDKAVEPFEVCGYVGGSVRECDKDWAMHGRFLPRAAGLLRGAPLYDNPQNTPKTFGSKLRIGAIVESTTADQYWLGISHGNWQRAAEIKDIPKVATNTILATGPWGRVRMIPPPPRKPGQVVFRPDMPVVWFVVEPTKEPREMSTWIRLWDTKGREIGTSAPYSEEGKKLCAAFLIDFDPNTANVLATYLNRVAKVTVETRPFVYAEFKNVHYDRDQKYWDAGHVGKDGETTISKAGGVASLVGLIRPERDPYVWSPGEFFAPDGKPWRNFPDRSQLSPQFSGGFEWPENPYVAVVKFEPDVVDNELTASMDVFASDSSEPGKGLRESLKQSKTVNFGVRDGIIQQMIVSGATKSPYIQIRLRTTDKDWKVVGSAPLPSEPLAKISPEELEALKKGNLISENNFTAILRQDGGLAYWYKPKGQRSVLQEGLLKWDATSKSARLVARTKAGKRIVLGIGGPIGSYDTQFTFNLDKKSSPIYSRNGVALRLSDVAAFEVETRTFGEPMYMVAKLPAKD